MVSPELSKQSRRKLYPKRSDCVSGYACWCVHGIDAVRNGKVRASKEATANSVGQRLNVERLSFQKTLNFTISQVKSRMITWIIYIWYFGVTWAIRHWGENLKRSAILRRATIPRRHLFAKLPHAHKLLTKRIFYCEKDQVYFHRTSLPGRTLKLSPKRSVQIEGGKSISSSSAGAPKHLHSLRMHI
jgi:hypothetical protein